jgi:hypothetical protein
MSQPLVVEGMGAVDEPASVPVGESRWPMALAVLTVMGLSLFQSSDLSALPVWFGPLVEGVLLAVLIVADPGRIDHQSKVTRTTSLVLVGGILISALTAAWLLTQQLSSPSAGSESWEFIWGAARVWVTINIAFALLYWQLDSGGPVTRLHHPRTHKDFLFPQQADPDIAPAGWFPTFIDYLYVGFTTGNAFSPTDTMPLVHWAKIAMATQALISFVIVGLVIARVVNVI